MGIAHRGLAFALAIVGTACGGDDGPGPMRDAGPGSDAGAMDAGEVDGGRMDSGSGCSSDGECDDGAYCNGTEACVDGACQPGEDVDCDDGITCTLDVCSDDAAACRHTPPDGDGDGHGSASCVDAGGAPLGDDCDDSDSLAFPGNDEVCDGHDEDCNPDTLGFLDADGDGSSSSACCNAATCGPDCNDSDSTVRPGIADGPPSACDTIDNDCDGSADEGCPCVEGLSRECGTDPERMRIGICRPGSQFCVGGAWTETCTGAVPPDMEICDTLDNDCDGTADEDVERTFYRDVDSDGYGLMGETAEACSAPMGYTALPGDCDDTNAGRNPAAPEVCNLGDDDCDGTADEGVTDTFYRDTDGDGFGVMSTTMEACSRPMGYADVGTDCDDAMAAVHPGVADVCNGVDDDCMGGADPGCTCVDGATRACGSSSMGTCRMGTQRCVGGAWGGCVGSVEPVPESCNGADDDCDGMVDDGVQNTYYRDVDGDDFGVMSMTTTACSVPMGYSSLPTDCNDADAAINPAAFERCNTLNDDCDATTDEGCTCVDGRTQACGTSMTGVCRRGTQQCVGGTWGSCIGNVEPGAESCNALDDDCDGMTDEMLTVGCYLDADSDGAGTGALTQRCPDPARTMFAGCPVGWSNLAGDCNDSNGSIRPGGTETCNGIDDDCDSMIDDGVLITYYRDSDRDGYGATAMTMTGCTAPSGYVAPSGDCNDANAAIYPGAFERCNGVDDNCTMGADEGCMCTDGATRSCGMFSTGVCRTGTQQCVGGMWGTCVGNVDPGTESCNGLDDDCDGMTDETLTVTCYADGDSDGYGAGSAVQRCPDPTRGMFGNCPAGYTNVSTDCNDANAAVRPGVTETCNGIDDNCTMGVDEGLLTAAVCHVDADGDTYGTGSASVQCRDSARAAAGFCPVGYYNRAMDCNDTRAASNPGAMETCNGIDDDCDMTVDDGVLNTYYRDNDRDGYGQTAMTATGCTAPAMYAAASGDCNDTDASIYPGAPETCDGIDENCTMGIADEPVRTFYLDADDDFYGNSAMTMTACSPPMDHVELGGDCNDADFRVRPGALEACNGADDDCDGTNDDGADGWCAGAFPFAEHITDWACPMGSCVPTCAPPWDNCDGMPGNGCEINVNTDSDHCGACRASCPTGALCIAGMPPSCAVLDDIVAGSNTSCAHWTSGTYACWGNNESGRLGVGSTFPSSSTMPIAASALSGPASYLAIGRGSTITVPGCYGCNGDGHACFVRSGNVSFCYGRNEESQLGDGTTISPRPDPVYLGTPAPSGNNGWGLGSQHTCRIVTPFSGTRVECAGTNTYGQLGNGAIGGPPQASFVPIASAIPSPVSISAGSAHTCVRRGTDNRVLCWGEGSQGQLGNGMLINSGAPQLVVNTLLPNVTGDVAAGASHTCAVHRTTSVVYCWGDNLHGALGNGMSGATDSNVPVSTGLVAAQVVAGYGFTCARTAAGQVHCWGRNFSGQLGDGTTTMRTTPTPVVGLTNVTRLAAGFEHVCALRDVSGTRSVVCWGENNQGQLGDGTNLDRTSPTPVTF